MAGTLRAEDLLPIVDRLSHGEQVRLVKLVLNAAGASSLDAAAYAAKPEGADEFVQEDDGAGWEGEGWEAGGASR